MVELTPYPRHPQDAVSGAAQAEFTGASDRAPVALSGGQVPGSAIIFSGLVICRQKQKIRSQQFM